MTRTTHAPGSAAARADLLLEPLKEGRKLAAGVQEALLILHAAEQDGDVSVFSAASNNARRGDAKLSNRAVSGRATTAMQRRGLVSTQQTRRVGRIVTLTDTGRRVAIALATAAEADGADGARR